MGAREDLTVFLRRGALSHQPSTGMRPGGIASRPDLMAAQNSHHRDQTPDQRDGFRLSRFLYTSQQFGQRHSVTRLPCTSKPLVARQACAELTADVSSAVGDSTPQSTQNLMPRCPPSPVMTPSTHASYRRIPRISMPEFLCPRRRLARRDVGPRAKRGVVVLPGSAAPRPIGSSEGFGSRASGQWADPLRGVGMAASVESPRECLPTAQSKAPQAASPSTMCCLS